MLVLPEEVKAFRADWKVFEVDWQSSMGGDGRDQYLAAHIPGAEYLSIQDHLSISREKTNMPFDRQTDPEALAASLRELGLRSTEDPVVLYARGGAVGVMGATRAWWVLSSWGFKNLALLNGGWEAWQAAGFSASSGKEKKQMGMGFFDQDTLQDKPSMRADAKAVAEAQRIGTATLMDTLGASWPNTAQTYGKKLGEQRMGHIYGAMNVPCTDLLKQDHTWRSKADIGDYFTSAGFDMRRPVIAY